MVNVGDPVKVSPLIKFFRYSFLIAGIFYGMSKKKALEVWEAGRREEKERLKAERDAQIAAEKKAASERDIQQIVSIFMPDEPKFRVEDQSLNMKENYYQPVDKNTSSSCVVEGMKRKTEEEIDLSPLNDYTIIEKGNSVCSSVPQAEQSDDNNIFSDNNDTEQDLSTYFVPQPDEVPFAAGESENFYPTDDDDDGRN